MDPFSLEDFLSLPHEKGSPGAQLYLYRTLHLLASRELTGSYPVLLSYRGAKKLASQLGLTSQARLVSLFNDLGIGTLKPEIHPDEIIVILKPSFTPAGFPQLGGGCELERGLIDGALELLTGLPVTTEETSCWTRGDSFCRFEATLQDYHGAQRFAPRTEARITGQSTGNFKASETAKLADTGVTMPFNIRSWFLDLAGRELARARRHNRSLSILYIDLDNLGEINQLHGRKAGDQVIRAVAAALSKSCRLEDFIWHHGEDEFVVLLSETDAGGAKEVAQRLTTQILSAAKYVEVAAKVSASIGYSTYPNHSDTVTGLVANARSALYLAKALGKGIAQEAMTNDFPKAEKTEVKQEEVGQIEVEQVEVDQVEVEQAAAYATASKPAIPHRPEDLASFDTPVKSTEETDKKPAATAAIQTATVLIASASPLLMAGMKQVLSEEGAREKSEEGARESGISLAVVREITSPEILAEAVADTRPDLIFTDLQMATAKDFAVAKLLEAENLPCKLAVYISDVNSDVLKLAADFSIDGIIMQNTPPADIAKALGEIYKGKTVFPEEVQSSLSELKDNRRLLSDLSEREIEVLKLVAEGKSNSQISKELYVTVNTVRFHLANIYQKLGVTNRTEAANYYLRQDLSPNGQTKLL